MFPNITARWVESSPDAHWQNYEYSTATRLQHLLSSTIRLPAGHFVLCDFVNVNLHGVLLLASLVPRLARYLIGYQCLVTAILASKSRTILA